MKKFIIGFMCILLFSCHPVTSPAFASVTENEAITFPVNTNEELSLCKDIAAFAYVAMQVRQGGMSLKDALDSQPKPSSTATQAEKEMLPLLQAILYEAYKQPLYHTEEYKKEIITEFSKDVYLACIGD